MNRWTLGVLFSLCAASPGFSLSPSTEQLIVSIAPGWDSPEGLLQLFSRTGNQWHADSAPVRVLYGKSGLAWGRGELGTDETGLHKVEHDHRAPAGVFKIGTIYTYDQALPPGANYPFHTITGNDAWVDDSANPYYNQHVVMQPAQQPPWFEKQKMRLDDPPHRWLVEIRHNADPPVPGAGSAIFFHIERGPNRNSSGCTVMQEQSLVTLIRWLRQEKNPHYVLLPKAEYLRLWRAWGLPDPKTVADLLN